MQPSEWLVLCSFTAKHAVEQVPGICIPLRTLFEASPDMGLVIIHTMYDACFTCVSVTPVAGITCSYNYVETCTTAACCVHRMMLLPWLLTLCSVGAISYVSLVAMNLGECSAQFNVVSMRFGRPHALHLPVICVVHILQEGWDGVQGNHMLS